ncbi:phage NinH family protein [Mixta hanseatica]|uniref:Phage NinH family protein n=1 Tax=Mixta hanseatica TaxID=2872648 RepID=A0ABY4REQ7_9GAMM|nr:phage NinH family protein [Mixta hanseatica]UQY45281.1 phage NinH family protein [Mixta hanseatica]
MNATIETIPELLVKTRGNMTGLAQQLKSNRATIRKYARDFNATHHAIVNGVLMTFRGQLGAHKREGKCDKE